MRTSDQPNGSPSDRATDQSINLDLDEDNKDLGSSDVVTYGVYFETDSIPHSKRADFRRRKQFISSYQIDNPNQYI